MSRLDYKFLFFSFLLQKLFLRRLKPLLYLRVLVLGLKLSFCSLLLFCRMLF